MLLTVLHNKALSTSPKKRKGQALGFTHAPLRLVKGVGDSFRSLPIQTVP